MTATSHAITGAAIGVLIKEPILALPLAFVSHFVFDSLPHFGFHTFQERKKHDKSFRRSLYIDAFLLTILFFALLAGNFSWVVIACAILAGSPDFAWAYRYIFLEKKGKIAPPKMNRFNQFHSDIQQYESRKGYYYEVGYCVVMVFAATFFI